MLWERAVDGKGTAQCQSEHPPSGLSSSNSAPRATNPKSQGQIPVCSHSWGMSREQCRGKGQRMGSSVQQAAFLCHTRKLEGAQKLQLC